MSTINKVVLLGNVGNTETRDLDGGKKIVQISIATSDGYKKGDEFIDKTEWHRCIFAIPALAERASTIKKGDKVYVEGSISTNSWTTKEGEKKEIKEISCTTLKVFSRAEKADSPIQKDNSSPQKPIGSDQEDDLPF